MLCQSVAHVDPMKCLQEWEENLLNIIYTLYTLWESNIVIGHPLWRFIAGRCWEYLLQMRNFHCYVGLWEGNLGGKATGVFGDIGFEC